MKFLNTNIDNLTFDEALEKIDDMLANKNGGYVVTPNVDHIIRLEKDERFQKAYADASLVLTDGQPLIWISHLLKCPIKEKISGSDLFPKLCSLAAQKHYKMFFLGAAEGVADQAAENLIKKNPRLQIVGTYSPEYGFEKDMQKVNDIWTMIKEAEPDILVVGLGTPKQELFLWENRQQLGSILAFGFGAGLDFEAGKSKRAPKWMQRSGLEWLYRLCHEPKRLFKRYLIDDVKILSLVWKYRKANRYDESSN